jgi:SynChlorMet cassette protein ScmC
MNRANSIDVSPSLAKESLTGCPSRGAIENSYLLDLGFRLSWRLSASRQIQPLLEKLAGVLGIRAGRNDTWPRLVLGSNPVDFGQHHSPERIPTEGWTATDLMTTKIWSHSEVEDLFFDLECDGNPNDFFRMWSSIFHTLYGRAIDAGGLPLHAALIERNGFAVALAGESGRGKSTCCRRLPAPWRVLADDNMLLLPQAPQCFSAHPCATWGDVLRGDQIESSPVQTKVKLSAIFFLEHAQFDEIESIGPMETALRINQSAHQIFGCNVDSLEKPRRRLTRTRLFENACRISKSVKAYILRASLGGRFWERINDVLSGSILEG